MQAVICPVCTGEGQICKGVISVSGTAKPVPVLKECHGCAGRGWVVVPDVILMKPAIQPEV